MAYTLNEKMRALTPYDPIEGSFPVRLDANESFLNANDMLGQEIVQAVQALPLNRYPDPYAVKLIDSFCELYGLQPQHVTAGNGSDELISVIVSSFLQKGEAILTLYPDFSMYRFYGQLYENPVLEYAKDDSLDYSIDALLSYAGHNNVKMIIFSNPCNPTSLGKSADEMRRLIQGTDALVVLDEAYMDFWDQGLVKEAAQYDNLIVLKTCSKAIGLAGIRLGFAVANPTLTGALRAAKSPYNVNLLTQAVGTAVLRQGSLLQRCKEKVLASRDELYAGIDRTLAACGKEILLYESKTNFVFLRFPSQQESERVFHKLMERGIIIRRMGAFLRVTAGTPDENRQFLQAFADILRAG